MRIRSAALGAGLLGATAVSAAQSSLPVDKVYGTNLGSWLLAEPWMFPKEWVEKMGGESCEADCSSCAYSEFDLVKKLGQEQADKVFEEHWKTWFTEKDADIIKNAGLNTIRIPLGYWIVESLVDRSTEYYPRGGLKYLKKGLRWFKQRDIHVMLDHHALPGVASANQMFAGRCTSDVQFYTEKNYKRALIWAGFMTAMTHTDPDWSTVFSIEAINEPIHDANLTPGYGTYQKQFVDVMRAVEYALGVPCPDTDYSRIFDKPTYSKSYDRGLLAVARYVKDPTVAAVLKEVASILKPTYRALDIKVDVDLSVEVSVEVEKREAAEPIVPHGSSLERRNSHRRLHHERAISAKLGKDVCRTCLSSVFQNMHWQYNNPPNPADAANGPQVYDAHLYFSFGGVADPNPESYMRTICNTNRVAEARSVGNSPLVFGEWSVAVNFNATPSFYQDWLDAQRTIYAHQADGWLFWSYKLEEGNRYVPDMSWSATYNAGYFTKDDPSKLKNPDVCKPWIANSTTITA
ncbi:putative glucan endo-1,6-beta-glucosidase B OS=Aspergillus oryzae (strain ATCC 42149 / RIB 40) GN=exgB PE=3 SV=1 [Rhizoctonia solani AG-1 IB]|uniref:Putative glucan endo-1,6-beta-glucosidase B n=1 Tax=Thanatephorus cucumeris (strain AG1-IB / isolate 7/3/14) TaxID=1108050 RepID=A0A0B7FSB3_THACB|nr:putative glucan endo-1,6-beta-glucosidase B OS=Aspergillus oryzae (strain ATCC 42149 / RIB 40) GN=exgB PE=3 SV=1 [Rhizoctonia solani AG-1 IB]